MDAIRNLIYKFANSFDLKDWDSLRTILSETIYCDYSDLRNTKEMLSSQEYIERRQASLSKLSTQHIFSNLEIYVADLEANCRCSALILRRFKNDYFTTHAIYEFAVCSINNNWYIAKIKQQVLWNEGNPDIHSGVKLSNISKD